MGLGPLEIRVLVVVPPYASENRWLPPEVEIVWLWNREPWLEVSWGGALRAWLALGIGPGGNRTGGSCDGSRSKCFDGTDEDWGRLSEPSNPLALDLTPKILILQDNSQAAVVPPLTRLFSQTNEP